MILQRNLDKDAPFDFLAYAHDRLLKRFYSNGLEPEKSLKDIFWYFSQLFRFDKSTSKKVLILMERKGYVSIERSRGNGNYIIVIKKEAI